MRGSRIARVLVLMIVLALAAPLSPALGAKGDVPPQPKPGPDEGTGNQDPYAALPNLSFPVVMTDTITTFYQTTWVDLDGDGVEDGNERILTLDEVGAPIPIVVAEDISDTYTGSFPGQVEPDGSVTVFTTYVLDENGCAVDLVNNTTGDPVPDGIADLTDPILMTEWLQAAEPWYPQPRVTTSTDPNDVWNTAFVSDYTNSWQADWAHVDEPVLVDFIDWGNPLENTYPLVGYRFPVEVTLHTKLAEPMTAFKMACLEYPSSKIELFGTSRAPAPFNGLHTFDCYYATVLTNRFIAEIWNPDGSIERIDLGPGIGPSGKMNFASASGGWIPRMTGTHRIWLHVTDPLISLGGAIVNNDEHYVMWSGCMAEELAPNKTASSGVIGNSVFIDVLVKKPNSKK